MVYFCSCDMALLRIREREATGVGMAGVGTGVVIRVIEIGLVRELTGVVVDGAEVRGLGDIGDAGRDLVLVLVVALNIAAVSGTELVEGAIVRCVGVIVVLDEPSEEAGEFLLASVALEGTLMNKEKTTLHPLQVRVVLLHDSESLTWGSPEHGASSLFSDSMVGQSLTRGLGCTPEHSDYYPWQSRTRGDRVE